MTPQPKVTQKKRKEKKKEEKEPYSRVKNIGVAPVYSHVEANDVKNMKAKLKRNSDVFLPRMEDIWRSCGVPSIFISFSELNGIEVLISPSDATQSPAINEAVINTLGNSLKRAAIHHPENYNPNRENQHLIIISIAEGIKMMQSCQNNKCVEDEDMQLLIDSVMKKCSNKDIAALGNFFSEQKTSLALADPITDYKPITVACYIVLVCTILEVDEYETVKTKNKIAQTQRWARDKFKLSFERPCHLVKKEDLAGTETDNENEGTENEEDDREEGLNDSHGDNQRGIPMFIEEIEVMSTETHENPRKVRVLDVQVLRNFDIVSNNLT